VLCAVKLQTNKCAQGRYNDNAHNPLVQHHYYLNILLHFMTTLVMRRRKQSLKLRICCEAYSPSLRSPRLTSYAFHCNKLPFHHSKLYSQCFNAIGALICLYVSYTAHTRCSLLKNVVRSRVGALRRLRIAPIDSWGNIAYQLIIFRGFTSQYSIVCTILKPLKFRACRCNKRKTAYLK